jgi:polyisoprenoid-binding protein YceI
VRRLLPVGMVALLGPTACLAAPAWTIVPAESSLGFQVSQAGGTIAGSFRRFTATIAFDPQDLETSQVQVSIDIASITTGAAERDQELPKPEWFDIARFPRATFIAERFRGLGRSNYLAEGTLTLRDAKVPVSLPFTLELQGNSDAVMQGKVDLDRTAFGVGQGPWATSDIVGHKVTVVVRLKAHRAG